jgi:putative flippase GtrA
MAARSTLARAAARLASGLLTKHLSAALLATAVDFAVMVALVELAGIGAEIATLAGAVLGGITNFTLGRAWVYRAAGARAPAEQAARYAAVSAASAGLNALGEHVALAWAPAHYAVARAVVAVLVSICWGYPMQRYVVFAPRPSTSRAPRPAAAPFT